MPSVTISRLDAVQRWPAWKNAPLTATDTAVGRSASSSTMSGFLPPISSCTRAPALTAAAATDGPTSCDPVKLTASTSGDAASAAPSFEPGPITRFSTPGGRPARWTMSTSVHGDAGTSSAGLNTTVLPNASAGAIFQAGIASGKFHGVIAATTPSGSRVTSTSMPGRTESIFSPPDAQRFAGEELEDRPGARGLADAVGERLALLAREQPAELVLARQNLGARAVEHVEPLLRRRPRPLRERLPRRRDRLRRDRPRVARANSPTTSLRFDGLMSVLRSVESTRGRR